MIRLLPRLVRRISSPIAINVRKTSTTTSNDSTYGRLRELYKEHNEKEKETIETLIDTIKRNKDYTLVSTSLIKLYKFALLK